MAAFLALDWPTNCKHKIDMTCLPGSCLIFMNSGISSNPIKTKQNPIYAINRSNYWLTPKLIIKPRNKFIDIILGRKFTLFIAVTKFTQDGKKVQNPRIIESPHPENRP